MGLGFQGSHCAPEGGEGGVLGKVGVFPFGAVCCMSVLSGGREWFASFGDVGSHVGDEVPEFQSGFFGCFDGFAVLGLGGGLERDSVGPDDSLLQLDAATEKIVESCLSRGN